MALTGFGLTAGGFQRPSLAQIVQDTKDDFIGAFGSDLLVTDDSVAGQMATIIADREDNIWKLMEEVYSNFTVAGAEGIYLDDLVNKFNIFRRAASKSSGTVHVETDSTALIGETFNPASVLVVGDNSLQYRMSGATQNIFDNRSGFKVLAEDVIIGSYTFKIIDPLGILQTFTYTVNDDGFGAPDETDVKTMLISLGNFVTAILDVEDTQRVYTKINGDLFVGFNAADDSFVSLDATATMFFEGIAVGNFYSAVDVESDKTGKTVLTTFESFNPQPTGFVGLETPVAPFEGADIETDSRLRARFQTTQQSTGKATRDAIFNALTKVEGVSDIAIYDNPTSEDGFNAADAYTFLCVVIGGSSSDVAQAIYDTKPINVGTSGTTSIGISTADGDNELIHFTVGVIVDYELEVQYRTKDGLPINSFEEAQIRENLIDVIASFRIGETIPNSLLVGSVHQSSSLGRFIEVSVGTREKGTPNFSNDDIQLLFNQKAELAVSDTTFSRQV